MQDSKYCAGCKLTHPVSEFNIDRSRSDGLQRLCKKCRHDAYVRDRETILAKQAAAYAAAPEAKRESARRYYAENRDELLPRMVAAQRDRYWSDLERSRQQNREKHRRYYEADPEPHREAARRHYASNAEVCIARSRAWQKANSDQFREIRRRGRYRRKARLAVAQVFVVLPCDTRRQLERFRHRCAWCGGPGPLTVEHVIPISRGGSHGIGNLLPFCGPCNFSKSSKLLVEWKYRRP